MCKLDLKDACIPVSTDQCSTSEVPPISMAGSDISIQCSTLWAGNCTSCIHEASQACPSPPQSQGPEISGLFGRYPIDRERQGRCRASISSGEAVVGGPRFCDQSGEVTIRSNTMHRVSGIHGQLHLNDIHIANSKGEGSKEQVQASSKAEADDTPLGTYHRCVNSNPPCDSPGTSTLSRSSSAKDQRASPPPLIRIDDNIGETECDGFELVDQQCGDHQWETNSFGTTRLPEMTIESDASNTGWGACWNNQKTGGHWSFQESQLHINAKELLAAFLALQTFAGNREEIHVLKIDNMTAVHYINRMGGTHSKKLMEITSQIWNWSLRRRIFLSAEHLPGVQNVDADLDSSEWKLDPSIFQQIMQILGPCQVDLFASRISAQLPSWKPDPGAIATDALRQPWANMRGYAFPPFALIGRCLSKIQREGVREIILIAPVWPTQPWFSLLLSMLFRRPLLLPKLPHLINHNNSSHPLIHQLNLAAWPISGTPSIIKAFQAKQQPLSYLPGGNPQKRHIVQSSMNFQISEPGCIANYSSILCLQHLILVECIQEGRGWILHGFNEYD